MEPIDIIAFEKKAEKAKKHSDEVIKDFESWLNLKGITKKTVEMHVGNISFYAHNYLTRYDITPIEESIMESVSFFESFFIPKCMWANKTTINEYATSFKKFYSFMAEKGLISQKDVTILKQIIKEDKPYWISLVR